MTYTDDTFYSGRVQIRQPRKGFRFSVDAPILADFLPPRPNEEALEIGTGCGVVSLLALYHEKYRKIHGVELQERLFGLATYNAAANGCDGRFLPVHGDINERYRNYTGISVVFANPPFFPVTAGRLSPDPEIREARFETRLNLGQILEKSRRILAPGGALCLILPCERRPGLEQMAIEAGFQITRLREVFSFKDGKAERFLVQLTFHDGPGAPSDSAQSIKTDFTAEDSDAPASGSIPGQTGETVPTLSPAPLIIFRESGVYSDEMNRILTGQPNV